MPLVPSLWSSQMKTCPRWTPGPWRALGGGSRPPQVIAGWEEALLEVECAKAGQCHRAGKWPPCQPPPLRAGPASICPWPSRSRVRSRLPRSPVGTESQVRSQASGPGLIRQERGLPAPLTPQPRNPLDILRRGGAGVSEPWRLRPGAPRKWLESQPGRHRRPVTANSSGVTKNRVCIYSRRRETCLPVRIGSFFKKYKRPGVLPEPLPSVSAASSEP